MTALTRGTYEIQIRDRKTGKQVSGCRFDKGRVTAEFNRTLDSGTTAEVVVSLVDGKGCAIPDACTCAVDELRHELVFIRDDWNEPAWIGPIERVVDDPYQKTITYKARDRSRWWEGAAALRPVPARDRDAVAAFLELIQVGDEYENADLNYWFQGRAGKLPPLAELLVETEVDQGGSIWDAIVGLSKSVVDWTVVGPHLYWGSPTIPLTLGPAIRPPHWTQPPIIDRDASAVATQVSVVGAGGITGVYPPENIDRGRGRVSTFVSDTNLDTVEEATERAKLIYEQNAQPSDFIITGDGSVGPSFPQVMHQLIPGRLYPVEAKGQCLETSEVLQLFNVIVQMSSGADGGGRLRERRVALDFARLGSEGSAERASG